MSIKGVLKLAAMPLKTECYFAFKALDYSVFSFTQETHLSSTRVSAELHVCVDPR